MHAERLPRPSRAEQKAALESRIEQQRVDILVAAGRFRTATQPIDDGWHTLMRFKTPLVALGGLIALRLARRPGRLLRLGRRAAAGALVLNRARRLLR
ncbi:YqjK-like family protein [Halomonas sp.]|uniref:YqjK-like family protein n=1 Tax=Halomonas sp. TaxID=1486246 RepID=UPI0026345833|nr:YqjK-like family protein [Halomonas sp.]